jgi:Zn-dependent protease with chaperone function
MPVRPPIKGSYRRLSSEDREKLDNALMAIERDGPVFKSARVVNTIGISRLNAALLPGKRFRITKKMVRTLGEDELAGVIAHEEGHIPNFKKLMPISALYQLSTLVGQIAFLNYVAFNTRVDAVLDHLNSIPLIAAAFAGIAAVGLAMSATFGRVLRRDEMRADLNALKYGLGEDLISAFKALSKQSHRHTQILARYIIGTHPSTKERIRNIQEHSSQA